MTDNTALVALAGIFAAFVAVMMLIEKGCM